MNADRPTRRFPLASLPPALMLAAGLLGCSIPFQIPVKPGQPVAEIDGAFAAGQYIAVSDQPTAEEFGTLKADYGVTTVINLRSHKEMDRLANPAEDSDAEPLDQPALMEELGLEYHHIPLGGDDGYEPADLAEFARIIDAWEKDRGWLGGRILIHCASGGRARAMWAAYLIEHRDYSPAEADRIIRTLGQEPSAQEKLLGRELTPRLGKRLPGGSD